MMGTAKWCLLLLAGLMVIACRPSGEPPPAIAVQMPAQSRPVGSVLPIQDAVEHGLADQPLVALLDKADLFANHQIVVKERGEALLDFGDALRVTLFSNSDTAITMEAVEGLSLFAHFWLYRGGLIGEKALDDDRQVQIETPAGVQITVMGTTFFVTYDESSQITTVGNFDGRIEVVVDQAQQAVADSSYVVIGPPTAASRTTFVVESLLVNAAEFTDLARQLSSPLAAVDALPSEPEPTLTLTPTATPTATPTPSQTPSATSTATLIPTPLVPTATFQMSANCRSGPGLIYDVVQEYVTGERLPIIGRNSDASWWQLDADDIVCWVADSLVSVEHGTRVRVVQTPSPPTPTPTATSCPAMTVTVDAYSSHSVRWGIVGGCATYTATLTGRYLHQETYWDNRTFYHGSIDAGNDVATYPPHPGGCGTFTIRYTVTVTDQSGQIATNWDDVQVTWNWQC